MQCEINEEVDHSLVRLMGEVDLSSSPRARKAILDSLSRGLPLLVEMSDVSYLDSSGVASLVEGFQQAKTQDLKFGLVGVGAAALGVLELARLDKVFPIYSSVADYLSDAG